MLIYSGSLGDPNQDIYRGEIVMWSYITFIFATSRKFFTPILLSTMIYIYILVKTPIYLLLQLKDSI